MKIQNRSLVKSNKPSKTSYKWHKNVIASRPCWVLIAQGSSFTGLQIASMGRVS